MIAIIDYGAGNLYSVAKAIARLGYEASIVSRPDEVLQAQAVILPGVGSAGDAMKKLVDLRLDATLKRLYEDKRPLMGVCLGLQLLFRHSDEDGGYDCLGLLPGDVKKLPPGQKIPHMGWNQVRQMMKHPIFDGVPDGANFYFVHSYYADVKDCSMVAGQTGYGISFPTVLVKDNLVATQFHPEKSGELGLKLYGNFLKMHLRGLK
ncbi:MAG: imidazole glycerol phosphate synthase subunit HisH [Chloroflexi bacterium]|nr:imidazole glycerol phosphate synthase subunit HisH [Chloroflexota bacterium]